MITTEWIGRVRSVGTRRSKRLIAAIVSKNPKIRPLAFMAMTKIFAIYDN
jgi:hypothetical protein